MISSFVLHRFAHHLIIMLAPRPRVDPRRLAHFVCAQCLKKSMTGPMLAYIRMLQHEVSVMMIRAAKKAQLSMFLRGAIC